MTATGWEDILDPGERILWQGRPDGSVVLKVSNIGLFLFGMAFAGFALFWMIMASQAGGFFWAFGLIHFCVGLGISFGAVFWNAFRRRRTWYTLTDRRALIATDLPLRGRKLGSYPINAETVLEYDAQEPATIHFAHDYRRTKKGSNRREIGFERIDNGADVYAQLRAIQRGDHANTL